MKKNIVLGLTAAAAIIAVVILIFVMRSKKDLSVFTTGTVQGKEVNLASMISGRITNIYFKEGDKIAKDAVAIRLESKENAASVNQAAASLEKTAANVSVYLSDVHTREANLKSVMSDVGSADANLKKAEAERDQAKREYERYRSLYNEKAVSKSAYDAIAARYEIAAAGYNALKAGLDAAKSKKDAAEAQLQMSENQLLSSRSMIKEAEANLELKRATLDQTVIRSSMSGTVVFKSFEEGEFVSPGMTIMTVVDLDNLYVTINVEESLINRIRINDKAVIKVQGDEKAFNGRVFEIGKLGEFAAQKDVARGRQDIQTFRVKIDIENVSGKIKPGMTGEVEIPSENVR